MGSGSTGKLGCAWVYGCGAWWCVGGWVINDVLYYLGLGGGGGGLVMVGPGHWGSPGLVLVVSLVGYPNMKQKIYF